MKKQLTVLGISILLMTGASFTASAQKKEGKNNKKEHEDKQGNNHNKPAKASNGNGSKHDNNGHQVTQIEHKESKAKHYVKADKSKNHVKGNRGKKDEIHLTNNGNHDMKEGYRWNSETFKNRKKMKDQGKVTVCHKFKGDGEPAVAISVSSNALKAHMNHGDIMGGCPVVKSNLYSNTYLQKRTDYYNNIQHNQEQVSYSRSIYDYALARLTNSRLQLVTLQNNNMPAIEIERKKAVLVELEQNVSLLETLIGVAANIVVNKLQ
jgi:hypothetical protein